MKKVMVLMGLLSITALGAFAQYGRGMNDDSYANDRSERNERFDKKGGFEDNWGYDRDYNVVRGNKAMMINSYQRQAKMKIHDGMRKGLITKMEANKLMRYYENIERKENRFMRNGRISRNEANELERDLAYLNRLIAKERRDFDRSHHHNRF